MPTYQRTVAEYTPSARFPQPRALRLGLGAALRSRRKRLGYTQEDLADMLGFSPRLVGEIERGRGTVGIDKVLAFATALGIDVVAFER